MIANETIEIQRQQIGLFLKSVRKNSDMTMKDLTDASDHSLTKYHIETIENGGGCTINTFLHYLETLGVSFTLNSGEERITLLDKS